MNLIILSKFEEAWDSPLDILSYQKTKISIEVIIAVSMPGYFFSHSNIKKYFSAGFSNHTLYF